MDILDVLRFLSGLIGPQGALVVAVVGGAAVGGMKFANVLNANTASNTAVASALADIGRNIRQRNETCDKHLHNGEQLVDSLTSLVAEVHVMAQSTTKAHADNMQQMMELLERALNGRGKP